MRKNWGKRCMTYRKKESRKKYVVFAGIFCLAITGCAADTQDEDTIVQIEQPEESSYSLVVASVGDVVKTGRLRCTYRETEEEQIRIADDGKTVAKVYVAQGDRVVKGQLLAELETESSQESVEELEYRIARNTLLLSYTDINETYDLSGKWWSYVYQSSGSESDEEKLESSIKSIEQSYRYKREDYQDAIDLDRQQLENTLLALEQSRIYAGMDGEMSYVNPDLEGLKVVGGQTVMKIIDSTRCLFEARAKDTQHVDRFREGQPMVLTITKGRVTTEVEVLPYDMEHWEDTLYFELPERTEEIQVGTMGTIYYTIDSRQQVLTLPSRAIRTAEGKNYVYVLGENDIPEVKWIETGLWGDSLVEVTSGLEEGDYVVQK